MDTTQKLEVLPALKTRFEKKMLFNKLDGGNFNGASNNEHSSIVNPVRWHSRPTTTMLLNRRVHWLPLHLSRYYSICRSVTADQDGFRSLQKPV
jgi:hypothetical protein